MKNNEKTHATLQPGWKLTMTELLLPWTLKHNSQSTIGIYYSFEKMHLPYVGAVGGELC